MFPRKIYGFAVVSTAWLVLASVLAGCMGAQPSAISREPAYIVAVKSAQIPTTEPWVSRFADHTWFDLKNGSEENWERIEVLNSTSGVLIGRVSSDVARSNRRWGRDVKVVGLLTGEEAQKMIPQIEANARSYPARSVYDAWPGPNSNTFMAAIARETPGLHFQFNHNAVGKDYTPWFYFGPSVTGAGWQVDTLPLGLEIGFSEGVQLHLLQLTLGVSLFPPALELPFLPRLGFPIH